MKDQIWKTGVGTDCCALVYSRLVCASYCQLPLPAPITWLLWAAVSGNGVFAPSAAAVSCCESSACTAAAVTTALLACLTISQHRPKMASINGWVEPIGPLLSYYTTDSVKQTIRKMHITGQSSYVCGMSIIVKASFVSLYVRESIPSSFHTCFAGI